MTLRIPRRALLCLVIVLACCLRAGAALPEASLTGADLARYHRLCRGLISPCCWSQPVEVHDSPAAAGIRVEVASFIAAGRTDRQILDFFIQRYGERILAEPEGAKAVVLTTVPLLALAAGLSGLIFFLVRRRRPPAEALSDSAVLPEWPDFD